MTTRTNAKKASRDIYLFYAVSELRDLIVDDYLISRKEPNEELRVYLIGNLFKMALPSLHEKNLKMDLCKQVAARTLLSTVGVSEGSEESTAAVEANPYLQRKNVNPAPDPMLKQASEINLRMQLLDKQIIDEVKAKTLGEARLSFYESEITRLEEKIKELDNNLNKTAKAAIMISIAAASLAVLHKFTKKTGTLPSQYAENALSLVALVAPVVVTGIGAGIHVWNLKKKADRLKALEQEEKTLYQRSALLHLLLKGKAEKIALLKEASHVKKSPKWEAGISLKEHQEKFKEAKDAHLFGLHDLLLESEGQGCLDLCYMVLETGAKNLGLSDAHFTALVEVIQKTSYEERAELFDTLISIVATLHQSILEQKKQGRINFRVAEGNLGATAGSFAITAAKVAGLLVIPYTAPFVATALVVAGASTAYASYKTQKFTKKASEQLRKETTFKEIIKLSSPNPLAKEALLQLAGIPIDQQKEAEALFALHFDQ